MTNVKLILLVCISCWSYTVNEIICKPVLKNRDIRKVNDNDEKIPVNQEAIEFMQKFGYLDQTGPQALIAGDSLTTALKLVQRFGGLEQTGKFDNDTLKLVKSKRCGVPDITLKQDNGRKKRFTLPSDGWNKRSLTYYISNFTPKLPREGIRNEIRKAFNRWSQYSRLNFKEVLDNNADIVILFGVSYHGDSSPFDGPGKVLAHAYYPTETGHLAGDIHFDDHEDWTLNDVRGGGVDFYSVAIHEVGHSLGVGHSSEPNSIMNPYYKGPQPQDIGYDDQLAMYSLYIARTLPEDVFVTSTFRPQPAFVPKKPHVHWTSFDRESCTDHESVTPESFTTLKPEISTRKIDKKEECRGNFDAVSCFRGEIFVFKQNSLWRLNKPGSILPRYPVQLLRFFQVLADPDHNVTKIDAAYERPDSNIIMFIGNNYFIFNGNHLIENSPRSIMDYGFPPFVDKVDGVMVYGEPPLTYLFSGEYFWIYNDREKRLIQRHRFIREYFKGIKTPIDDVLTWKSGETYFFSGNQYWKFDHKNNMTQHGYPKNAAEFLLGCK